MQWVVHIKKSVQKQVRKLPRREFDLFQTLRHDLEEHGPIQYSWPNYSKLGKSEYHCHLSYKWVACWRIVADSVAEIEIYYAGSRENAPYG